MHGVVARRILPLGHSPYLNDEVAELIWEAFVKRVKDSKLSGFGLLMGPEGFIVRAQGFGKPRIGSQKIAFKKARTVWNRRRSTWDERLYEWQNGYDRADFGGLVETLFAGGVAIFADERNTELIAALTFSGGAQWVDHELCRESINDVYSNDELGANIYTDARPLTEEAARDLLQNMGQPQS